MATPSWLDKLTSFFRSEKAELDDVLGETEQRWSGALDQAEADLTASPQDRMASIQDAIAENDDAFDAIRDQLDD